MSTNLNSNQHGADLLGRLERLPSSGWQIKIRTVVGTATFFDAIDALMIAYIMPVLIPLWHISPMKIGPLLAISYVGQIVGAMFSGWLSEKIGRKKTLAGCMMLMGIMSLVCAFSWSYTSLLVFRFVQGFGLGGEIPIAATYINEWSKAKGRGAFVVLYESVFNLGLIVVALLGIVMIPAFGWQSMFILGAFPALLVPFFMKGFPESPRWLISKARLDEAEKAIISVEKEISEKYKKILPPVEIKLENIETKKTRFGELFQGIYARRTLTLWVMWFCFYFINYGLMTWLPTLYTSVFKLPLRQALLYSVAVNIVSFVAMIFSGLVVDKVGRKPLFIFSFSGLTVICFLLAMNGVKTAETLFTYTVIAGVCLTSAAVLYLYTPELYPTRMRGFGTSMSSVWLRVAAAIGPTLVGMIMAKYSLSMVFVLFGVIAVIGLIVTVIFAIETKNKILEEISP